MEGGEGVEVDAGPPPPHYFTYAAMPLSSASTNNGYVYPFLNSGTISVAIDSSGAPAVASYNVTPDDYGKQLVFWRPGTPDGVGVYSFSLDGSVDLSLAFDGTKPRIAGHMDPSTATPPLDNLAFVASDDGVTWSSVVHLPNNGGAQGTAFDSALALDGTGNAAVASNINGGNGGSGKCGDNPYIATSPADDGTGTWTACGADTTGVHDYGAYSVSALFGASRVKGTLVASFVSAASDDAEADQGGILFWQHP
jgi:hypothetical protein